MSGAGRAGRFAWLPDEHLHAAATLGHVDSIIDRVGAILRDYMRPGPIGFDNVRAGPGLSSMVVTDVAPIPEAVSRLTADALNQLRAALEHSVFVEVERGLGRRLSRDEAQRIELPVVDNPDKFEKWPTERRRGELAPLAASGELVQRMRALQPFHVSDPDHHPLRLLAEHTNLAKHRAPAVAATGVGLVEPDFDVPGLVIPQPSGAPLFAGEVLATGPSEVIVPMSVWPTVSIQRPHSGTWRILMKELGEIEAWVREIALPTLIAGTVAVPPLPAQFDVTIAHAELRAGVEAATGLPALARNTSAMAAEGTRPNLVDLLASRARQEQQVAVRWWVYSLDDDAVLARLDRLKTAADRDIDRGEGAVGEVIRKAVREHQAAGHPDPDR